MSILTGSDHIEASKTEEPGMEKCECYNDGRGNETECGDCGRMFVTIPKGEPRATDMEKAAEIARKWAQSPGMPNMEAWIATALHEGREAAIDECAKVARDYWMNGKNVYARNSGRAVESRILAMKGKSNG